MAMGIGISQGKGSENRGAPARLCIYYGYPSLVNGANGNLEQAATVFAAYDVVVLGDGLEFTDKKEDRYPAGDPVEHQRVLRIIEGARKRNPSVQFYGYVPLGDNQSLKPEQIEERTRLWKATGASGIFFDEAGYDFKIVNRERQNRAVTYAHELGLAAFMNGYFLDHLFRVEDNLPVSNGNPKNPKHLPPALDSRDLFLMESFQINNGRYEDAAHWQARMQRAVEYRRRYGTRIFAVTTTTSQVGFNREQFSYAWWSAWFYDVDGFGWGEPNFSATSNLLPNRRCNPGNSNSQVASAVESDTGRFWRRMGSSLVVLDTNAHSVSRLQLSDPALAPALMRTRSLSPSSDSAVNCEALGD